ncbi:MAG: hypothetical protein K0R24_2034 [Gammaproteobacteria bacterium]|nr:hypothetical protein [Gammaproteobacteria bacterium]
MFINKLLYNELDEFCPTIHHARLQALMNVATGLQHSQQFSISTIGRHFFIWAN